VTAFKLEPVWYSKAGGRFLTEEDARRDDRNRLESAILDVIFPERTKIGTWHSEPGERYAISKMIDHFDEIVALVAEAAK
jgi:hypothetical protein